MQLNLESEGSPGINMGILRIFTHLLGIGSLISDPIGIAGATVWNFTVNTMWAWMVVPKSETALGN